MAVGVASTGIHQTTNIKFSQLRREFKTISPRSTFDGDDNHSGDSGSVSASDLLRVNSLPTGSSPSADLINPVVPDVPENGNIVTTPVDWKIGGFKNAIKFYYLNQTGRDDNNNETNTAGFNLDDPTKNSEYTSDDTQLWTSYLDKNIVKVAFIDGIVGSVDATKPAMRFERSSNPYNVKIAIGGTVIGAGGTGGGVVGNIDPASDGDVGGNALNIEIPAGQHPTVTVNVAAGASVYAGGGGGGKGADGGAGGGDGGDPSAGVQCHSGHNNQWNHECVLNQQGAGTGAGGEGTGGKGGKGAGYIYSTDDTWYVMGASGLGPTMRSGRGGAGGGGGYGGTFGAAGGTGANGASGNAGTQHAGERAQASTLCEQNPVNCDIQGTAGQGGFGPGQPGGDGGGGKSISGSGWYWSEGSNTDNVTSEMLKGNSDVPVPPA